jgi:opacity protein-like surface antigen
MEGLMTRRWIVVLVLVVALTAASEVEAQKVELTPHIGYKFGGGLTDYFTATEYDFSDSESYGLTLNYTIGLMGDTQLDLSWSRQDTDVESFNFNERETFDVTIDYWQVGGLKQWNEDEPTRPFVIGSLGAAHFSPESAELSSATRFAFALGGGVKLLPSDHIGIRLQGKLYGTYGSGGGGVFCGTGGCAFGFSGNFMWQAEFSAGLIIAFGDS